MRIASETCIPEILKEAGSQGLHVKDIAAKTHTESNLLGGLYIPFF